MKIFPPAKEAWAIRRWEGRPDLRGAVPVDHDWEEENEVFDGARQVQSSDTQIKMIDKKHAEWHVQKTGAKHRKHGYECDSLAGEPAFVKIELTVEEHWRQAIQDLNMRETTYLSVLAKGE